MHGNPLYIEQYCRINRHQQIILNGALINNGATLDAVAWYQNCGITYPKFFKMDALCKWSWLAAAYIFKHTDTGPNAEQTGIVLHTHDGCIDVDRQYLKSTETIASPALFVYTLPNILMGEIAIQYHFKGPQTLLVLDAFDSAELTFNVQQLFQYGNTTSVLCGWVNVLDNIPDICLFYVSNTPSDNSFQPAICSQLYNCHG